MNPILEAVVTVGGYVLAVVGAVVLLAVGTALEAYLTAVRWLDHQTDGTQEEEPDEDHADRAL